LAAGGRRPWIPIVDERDAVSHEHVVLDVDAFAHERVARDLHAAADADALLDLDEGADLGLVSDLAAIQVHEVENAHIPAQLDVCSNRLKFHRRIRFPSCRSDCSAASSSETTRTPAAAPVIGSR